MYLAHINPDNKNKVRGLIPFLDNDPSYKELYDKGQPLSFRTQEATKYNLYEETPY